MTIYRGKGGKFASKAEIAAIKAEQALQDPPAHKELIAYKGFNLTKDNVLQCRHHEFEIGKYYEIKNQDPQLCRSGFHACVNPFDVFEFYSYGVNTVFGKVKLFGPLIKDKNKTAAKGITVLERFHDAHWVNTLAKYAKDHKLPHATFDEVNTNKVYQFGDQITHGGIVTNIAYARQFSTVHGQPMTITEHYGLQVGAADGQTLTMVGMGTQISAGNNSKVINLGCGSVVDIRGKYNHVVMYGESSKLRGPVDTRFEIRGSDNKIYTGTIGQNGIEPNKWIQVIRARKEIIYEIKLQ